MRTTRSESESARRLGSRTSWSEPRQRSIASKADSCGIQRVFAWCHRGMAPGTHSIETPRGRRLCHLLPLTATRCQDGLAPRVGWFRIVVFSDNIRFSQKGDVKSDVGLRWQGLAGRGKWVLSRSAAITSPSAPTSSSGCSRCPPIRGLHSGRNSTRFRISAAVITEAINAKSWTAPPTVTRS